MVPVHRTEVLSNLGSRLRTAGYNDFRRQLISGDYMSASLGCAEHTGRWDDTTRVGVSTRDRPWHALSANQEYVDKHGSSIQYFRRSNSVVRG